VEKSPPHASSDSPFAALPKAELHLHLEGCLTPTLLVQLAARHSEKLSLETVTERYNTRTFPEVLELFKWATSYLRHPQDYAQLTAHTLRELHQQNCCYAEITLSVGVMLLRSQDVHANFAAIFESARQCSAAHGQKVLWIFDAVRQFGPEKAMDVARAAVCLKSQGVVAFGLGGNEESLPASDFRAVYDYVASEGLHRLAHAGEIAGPQAIRDAIEILGAERIGHGISAIRDPQLMDLLLKRQIPLEICPQSNICTGALAKLLGASHARLEQHPLREFVSRGVPVTLATDDPAMFRTSLNEAYAVAANEMHLTCAQLISIAESGFRHSFLSAAEKQMLLADFRAEAAALNLL
jgi:aminodeoxyfutalosine deaminase